MINIRFASVRAMDISNGEGVGVALFVQGCHYHCHNCFNPETWDFAAGKEWTSKTKDKFLELIEKTYIKRISILGGEPLAEENLEGVIDLVTEINKKHNEIHLSSPQKSIWLYSGFCWEEIFAPVLTEQSQEWIENYLKKTEIRKRIISQCDVVVDGRYVDALKDISLKWRGSKNQRVIDVKKSLQQKKVVLWCN